MPSTPFFSCNFCSFKTKIQIDLNAHYLFTHFFENPDCSVAVPHEVENYMYSKEHFKRCISCNRHDVLSLQNWSSSRKESELQNVRAMQNYFCDNCFHDLEKTKEQALQNDKELSKYYNKKYAGNIQRYNRINRLVDGIWQYLQSVTSNRIRMYEKTLYRIHQHPEKECKRCLKKFLPETTNHGSYKSTNTKLCKHCEKIDPYYFQKSKRAESRFISNNYYGKEKQKRIDESRID